MSGLTQPLVVGALIEQVAIQSTNNNWVSATCSNSVLCAYLFTFSTRPPTPTHTLHHPPHSLTLRFSHSLHTFSQLSTFTAFSSFCRIPAMVQTALQVAQCQRNLSILYADLSRYKLVKIFPSIACSSEIQPRSSET